MMISISIFGVLAFLSTSFRVFSAIEVASREFDVIKKLIAHGLLECVLIFAAWFVYYTGLPVGYAIVAGVLSLFFSFFISLFIRSVLEALSVSVNAVFVTLCIVALV